MPSRSDEFSSVSGEQWKEIQESASRLDQALLSSGGQVNLLRFLPPPGAPHRWAALVELVRTEMEFRYRRDEAAPLERFCDRYHELGGVESLPPWLIYNEYRVRRLYGDRPELETYRKRFPSQYRDLADLMRRNPLPTAESPGEDTFETLEGIRDALLRTPEPATKISIDVRSEPSSQIPPARSQSNPRTVELAEGFEFIELMGRGEYGEVWRARRKAGGGEVAVKKILRSPDDVATQRELATLQKIRNINHPYLLQTQAFFVAGDHLYIVMDLADGSLSARFEECRAKGLPGVPAEELVEYITQAAEGLDYLHSRHMIHRDIKPQNLLMLQGYAKVADFGFARGFDQQLDDVSILCGTPHYMAPEIWRQQISPHSDQYALAATYYEVRTGNRPFAARNAVELALEHAKVKPDLSGVPQREQAVLRKALEKNPSDRYRNCTDFAEALQKAVAPLPRTGGFSWTAAFAVVALLVAVAGVVVEAIRRSGTGIAATSSTNEKKSPAVAWIPPGWTPVDPNDLVKDRNDRSYYRKIQKQFGSETAVMVVVAPTKPDDPKAFYILENKVWNALFQVFVESGEADRLIQTARKARGGEALCRPNWMEEWRKGGFALKTGKNPEVDCLGVDGEKLRFPVFRLTPSEAYCFAIWMKGRLPSELQWQVAAGRTNESEGINSKDPEAGPLRIDEPSGDVSDCGCRQMRTNGLEWTRTLDDKEELPLRNYLGARLVKIVGQSYEESKPLAKIDAARATAVTEATPYISFRVVIEE